VPDFTAYTEFWDTTQQARGVFSRDVAGLRSGIKKPSSSMILNVMSVSTIFEIG